MLFRSGLDSHTEDFIKELIDFLLEIELDLAEFTVLTPFPHTQAYRQLESENRIFSYNWDEYTADKVVYHPKHISAERLQELLFYAWDTFYASTSQQLCMSKLLQQVIRKEKADNTYQPRDRSLINQAFGRPLRQ